MPNTLSNYIENRVELLQKDNPLEVLRIATSTVLRRNYILTSPVMHKFFVVFSNLLPCRFKELQGMAERRATR